MPPSAHFRALAQPTPNEDRFLALRTSVSVGLNRTIDGGFLALKQTPAPPAEPISSVVDVAAFTDSRERRAAGRAKPAALPILRFAA